MARTALLAVVLIVFTACGGDGSTSITEAPSTTIASPAATCPSGVLAERGDGPDYLNFVGSHERALQGGIPDGKPAILGPASEAIPTDLMVGLEYIGCSALDGISSFEEMAWTNGIGLLLVSWHEWPRVEDPSSAPFGGNARQAGVVQVSQLETGSGDAKMRVVHLFDGLKVVSVSSYGLTTMGIDQVEDLGWTVYDGLPIDMEGAPEIGVTVESVLELLRSDQRTVTNATGIPDVSPFTSRAGAAPMSYSTVVDGTELLLYDFGVPEVASRAARMISTDGYSVAHQPHDWTAQPHFWRMGRVILLYQGGSAEFVQLLTEEIADPIAGGEIETDE
jgi:hypothetical protein